ncbi:DUF3533 domain-containing protein [Nocardioides sp. CER19]|uniref:DUF3533 domain-containing protein n=1 Tax=Nocardioides sp. CER19 TaxID=3038538 RepID=UPI00244C55AD|nr:DUF3533 domain-containing protein [Nocardioides sp. CER19]MDH2412892.1 DUF3533 domain-containing protein [Nocardioides sp. CER19]
MRPTFTQELRDAIAPRTVLLVLGVLFVQVAFIASYVGAFHQPTPHEVAVGVVAPAGQAPAVAERLNALDGSPLTAAPVADESTARDRLKDGTLAAAIVVDPSGTQDHLLVATARGASLTTAVEEVAQQVSAQQGRTITTTDVVPLQDGDARGLTGFYLSIGWLVGGYLVASLLGVAKGARPANRRRAVIRLGAMVPYAVVSGLTGALVVDQWLGALTGHFWAIAGVGMLLVLASATVTMALQVLFGTIGIGLTVLLFVVLGNPSAGGAYQTELLPALWRHVGQALPNGAGTTALREIVYFGGHGAAAHVWLIAGYAVVGTLVALAASGMRPEPADHELGRHVSNAA